MFSLLKQASHEGGVVRFHSQPTVKQNSTNSANWTISYDDDGNSVVEGSPQSMAFNFSKPVGMPKDGNFAIHIDLVGKLEQIKNGEVVSTQKINELGKVLVSNTESNVKFKNFLYDDAPYVFYLYHIENESKQTIWRYALLKDWQYKDLLEGKYTIREPIRRSGNFDDILKDLNIKIEK